MKPQNFLDATRDWLDQHALSVTVIVVVTIVTLKAAAVVNRRIFAKLFEGKRDADSEKLAQTVTSAAHWLISTAILLLALSFVLSEVGVSMDRVLNRALDWVLSNGLGIAIILAIMFVALKAASILAARLVAFLNRDKLDHESQKRVDTLSSVISWILRTGILLVAAVMLLGQLGVQIGPLLAAAGVAGLAVGFGSQHLVQDVISGFFLLLEDQVRVGDVVQLNDKSGLVEKITLRMTILRDFTGSVHYVRNGKIDVVTNMTKEYSYSVFDIGVAYREDTDQVSAAIEAVGKDLLNDPTFKDDILAPVEVVGLDKFADSAIIIKARLKTKPSKQWRVGREFNRRLKKKFDELGIEIPFPHLTLYPVREKKRDSPALKVKALVYDSRKDGLLVYLKSLNFDAQGHPVILFLASKGFEPGPTNGPREWKTVRWLGKEWVARPFFTSGNNLGEQPWHGQHTVGKFSDRGHHFRCQRICP